MSSSMHAHKHMALCPCKVEWNLAIHHFFLVKEVTPWQGIVIDVSFVEMMRKIFRNFRILVVRQWNFACIFEAIEGV